MDFSKMQQQHELWTHARPIHLAIPAFILLVAGEICEGLRLCATNCSRFTATRAEYTLGIRAQHVGLSRKPDSLRTKSMFWWCLSLRPALVTLVSRCPRILLRLPSRPHYNRLSGLEDMCL